MISGQSQENKPLVEAVCSLLSIPIPDPSVGSSPAGDVGIPAEAGDAVAENGIEVDGRG